MKENDKAKRDDNTAKVPAVGCETTGYALVLSWREEAKELFNESGFEKNEDRQRIILHRVSVLNRCANQLEDMLRA